MALIVEVTTDNRNRTVSEVRHAFDKNGGNLGEPNSVRFMFAKKGLIAIPKTAADEDKLMNIVLDAGGEDLNDEGENWEILTDPSAYEAVASAVKEAKVETSLSEITMIASTCTKLEGAVAAQMIRLLEALEDLDDVQNVYSNFDLDAYAVRRSCWLNQGHNPFFPLHDLFLAHDLKWGISHVPRARGEKKKKGGGGEKAKNNLTFRMRFQSSRKEGQY